MKNYEKTLLNLKQVVNMGRSKKGFDIGEEFNFIIKSLNDEFGKEITTKFLRNLVSLDKSNRQKTHRIVYLLKKSGLKTRRQNRYINGWIFQKWRTDKTEYGHKENGLIYTEFPRSLFNEQMILRDEEKLSLRNGINKGGGVFIKDIKSQNVGKFFKGNSKEVLYFITGF